MPSSAVNKVLSLWLASALRHATHWIVRYFILWRDVRQCIWKMSLLCRHASRKTARACVASAIQTIRFHCGTAWKLISDKRERERGRFERAIVALWKQLRITFGYGCRQHGMCWNIVYSIVFSSNRARANETEKKRTWRRRKYYTLKLAFMR